MRSTSKRVRGARQTPKDCRWIAELLQHGLLRSSYIPSLIIRDLRDLTRARTTRSQEHSRIASRIQKALEDANIKRASVASNTMSYPAARLGAIRHAERHGFTHTKCRLVPTTPGLVYNRCRFIGQKRIPA
jgi:transposase